VLYIPLYNIVAVLVGMRILTEHWEEFNLEDFIDDQQVSQS